MGILFTTKKKTLINGCKRMLQLKKNVVIVLKRWWTWLDVIPGDCLKTADMNELYCWSLILLDPAHKVWFLYLKLHYGTAFSRILSFAIPVMFFLLLLLLLLFITYHFCFKWTQPFIFTPETVHEWQLQLSIYMCCWNNENLLAL